MKLTVYTHKGHTYVFLNVNEVTTINKTIIFSYTDEISKKKSTASFHDIAGYSIAGVNKNKGVNND